MGGGQLGLVEDVRNVSGGGDHVIDWGDGHRLRSGTGLSQK